MKKPAPTVLETHEAHSFYVPHQRSATWYTGDVVNPITGEVTHPPSMTKQSFKDECDINNIIRQYKATGMINHVAANAARGVYADLPPPLDYQEALNIVIEGERAFESLPAKLRERFNNDPRAFLAFVSDPENKDEMVKLGLLKPPAPDPAPGDAPRGGAGGKPPADAQLAPPAAPEPPKGS